MRRVENFLYEDVTYKIRGACFKVWNEFKDSVSEKIIENALAIEFRKLGLEVEQQKRIDIFYSNQKVGTYISDLIAEKVVIVELKCRPFMSYRDLKQFWNYLKGSKYKLGLLINFGPKGLEIKRRVCDKTRGDSLVISANQRQKSA